MSVQPRRARWCTRLLPTMPAPITTTRAVLGTEAMGGSSEEGNLCCVTRNSLRHMRQPQHASPPPRLSTRHDGGESGPLRLEPGVDLVGVGLDPLLGRVVGRHPVLGDVGGDEVLVVVADPEV